MPARPVPPSKLRPGDHVPVIAPSRSRELVLEHDHSALIEDRFAEKGLSLSFGEHVEVEVGQRRQSGENLERQEKGSR
jgi:muramoyltetrapeptide carboxypeptidase